MDMLRVLVRLLFVRMGMARERTSGHSMTVRSSRWFASRCGKSSACVRFARFRYAFDQYCGVLRNP